MPPEHAFDEGVEGAIHDGLDIAGFDAGAEVFDHLVGLEDVGADLAAPADFSFAGVDAVGFGAEFVLFDLVEFGAEEGPGEFTVAELGAFLGASDHDAGGEVFEVDGGLDLVDVLSAFATGAHGVEFDVGVGDLDVDFGGDLGGDIDGAKGSVAFAGGVEGGDADEAVDAAFAFQVSVGVVAIDLEGHGFAASALTFLEVEGGDGEALSLCPAAEHALDHVGPVAGFGATCSGLDGEVGIVDVGRFVEEGDELVGIEVFFDRLEGRGGFSRGVEVVEFLGEFDAGDDVFELLFEFQERIELSAEAAFVGHGGLGFFLVVPEIRGGGSVFDRGDFSFDQGDVKDTS